jgi:biopolymer transport protein TolR
MSQGHRKEDAMSLTLGSSVSQSAEINVTPLIDVLLVLLIIFMLVVPNRTVGEAAEIPLPEHNQKTSPPESSVVVQLRDSGEGRTPTLRINQQDATWESLEPQLVEIFKGRAEKTAFIKSDSEIDFDYVAQALDRMHLAGIERIGLISASERLSQTR